jgi:Thioredoxin-like
MRRFIMVFIVLLMSVPGVAANENPIAVGLVNWGRDLNQALETSGETGRPVLVLFQEVPGCSGCQDFGRTVLTNPQIVEAVEHEFLPVLVYNNRGGADRQLLERFDEPAWNFQVVRFFGADGRDIIPRKDHIWTVRDLATRMIEALQATSRPVPKYLQALAEKAEW